MTDDGVEGDRYRLRLRSFAASACRWGVGSLMAYTVDPAERQFLVPSTAGPFEVTGDELRAFASQSRGPLLVDGELRWDV